MAEDKQTEVNYYPITDVSSSSGTPENPAPNTPAVPETKSNEVKTGGASIFTADIKSQNYVKSVAGWLLGIDGVIRAVGVVLSGTITATLGYIGGWVISATKLTSTSGNVELDSANETITVGDITIDGSAGDIESDNYVAGVAGTGFHLDADLLEVGNIAARGIIRTAVFQKDVISSVGGSFAVIDSDVLATDMTAVGGIEDGLLAYYKLDDNLATTAIVDSSGNGYNGTFDVNTNTVSTAGKINTALTFNNANKSTLAYDSAFNLAAFTLSAWIYPTDFDVSDAMGIFMKLDTFLFRINKSDGKLQCFTNDGSYHGFNGPVIQFDTWTHVVFTYDGTEGICYVDGADFSSANIATPDTFTSQPVYIGMQDGSRAFGGKIDEAGIWNRALTPAEVTRLYNADSGLALANFGATMVTKDTTTFTVGDILRIKDGTDDEWMEVTVDNGSGSYLVKRDKDADYAVNTNPTWTKGASIVNYQQTGDGLIYMTASDTNAPYLEVQTHAGSPWSALTTRLRLGNLNGFLDYASDLYGIAIGETNKFLKYDPTNGLEIRGQSAVSKVFTANRAISAGNAVMIGNGTDDYKEAAQETDDATAYTVTNTAWVAQTFTTSNRAVSIKSVTMNGNQNDGGGADTVTVSIRATATGVPTGADLESETKTFQTPAGQQDNTVTFDTPIPVDANTVYSIILRTTGGTNFNWIRKDSSVYAGGQAATSANSGSTWTGVGTKDMRFYVNEIETLSGKIDKATALAAGDLVNNFIGFAIDAITAGSTGAIIISGSDNNQTGLTTGQYYYLSDTPGAISTSVGSVSKKIGLSLSATEILILNS